jgi:hypothetical protein
VNIDWKLILSAAVFVFSTVTGPILWMLRSEGKAIRAELALKIAEMEKRLNERIDTRLVHR